MSGISKATETYKKWWVGKYCRIHHRTFKKVTDVIVTGPPSYVYGIAKLVYEDGTDEYITDPHAFRPRKKDVEVAQGEICPECAGAGHSFGILHKTKIKCSKCRGLGRLPYKDIENELPT